MTWKEVLDHIEKDAIKDAETMYKFYGNNFRAGEAYKVKCCTALSAMFLAGVMPHEDFSREYDRVAEYEMKVIWTHEWVVEQDQKIIAEVQEKRLAKAGILAEKEDVA